MLACSVPIVLNAILPRIGMRHTQVPIPALLMKAGVVSITAEHPVVNVIRRRFVKPLVPPVIKMAGQETVVGAEVVIRFHIEELPAN